MTTIQFIERDGKREFAVIPMELFERLAEAFEELEDLAALETFRRNDDGFRVPGEVLHAILDGTHAIKAWREWRGITQEALAEKACISKAYLCQIETGKREGSVKTLKAIADALAVSLDDLREG